MGLVLPRRLVDTAGVAYTLGSACLGIAALLVLEPYMANDCFWPGLSTTVNAVANLVNFELALASAGSADLLHPSSYAAWDRSLGVQQVSARSLMLQSWTSFEIVINGLRALSTRQVANDLVTLYCWADVGRKWELALSAPRQARCNAHMAPNAAVYLETTLRNIDYAPIATTGRDGVTWLDSLLAPQAPVAVEAARWTSHGLAYYRLQWGNSFAYSLAESLAITNGLGLTSQQLLKVVPGVPRSSYFPYTSLLLNSALLQFVFYALAPNTSLIRNTPSPLTYMSGIQAFILGFALSELNLVLQNTVGPLCIIDAYFVPPPIALTDAVHAFRTHVLTAMVSNATLATALEAVGDASIQVTPRRWRDPALRFYGGNPLCNTAPLRPYVQASFGFDSLCGDRSPLSVTWHVFNSLFAWHMLGQNDVSGSQHCALGTTAEHTLLCFDILARTKVALVPATFLAPLPIATMSKLRPVGVSQVVWNQSVVTLEMQPLLDGGFAFFGWMGLYDWAMTQREVIAFEGDVNTLHILSPTYPTVPQPLTTVAGTLGPFLWSLAALGSVVASLLALGVVALWITIRPQATRWHLFQRLVGTVWLSRSIVVARSVCAIAALATAPIGVQSLHNVESLAIAPRTIWISGLLAYEASWLTTVVQEIVSPVVAERELAMPIACLIVFLIDVASPVTAAASLERKCTIINLTTGLECNIGSVTIGWFSRCVLVAAICVLCGLWSSRNAALQAKSLLLPALSRKTFAATGSQGPLDSVTAVMCGLFLYSSRSVFDVKLWLRLPASNMATLGSPATLPVHQAPNTLAIVPESAPEIAVELPKSDRRLSQWLRYSIALAGLAYLGGTLTSNVAYISVLGDAMANDFGWSGFSTAGTYVFLARIFHEQLVLGTNATELFVTLPTYGDVSQLYNTSDTSTTWWDSASHQVLYDPNVLLLTDIVKGLRSMNPCQLPWMFTQYCFLDFGQQWEMANSVARQRRCERDTMASNAAVYLEASLRNVRDWAAWNTCWRSSFEIGIARELMASPTGRLWLATTRTASTSIEGEVGYWQRYGKRAYVLQWQNYKTSSFSDALTVTSALGLTYTLPISKRDGAMHLDAQTSLRMYWSWANDLLAIADNSSLIAGRSLLRSSAAFAFSNVSSGDLLVQAQHLPSPLSAGLALVRDLVRPFGSMDVIYVPCPDAIRRYYGSFTSSVHSVLLTNLTVQAEFWSLSMPAYFGDVPAPLLETTNLLLTGGNLMCGDDIAPGPLTFAVYTSFGSFQLCSTTQPDHEHTAAPVSWDVICDSNPLREVTCTDTLLAIATFLDARRRYVPSNDMAKAAEAAVRELNVTVLQFVIVNGSSQLYQVGLVDPKLPSWHLNGWLLTYEWVAGLREVVSFRGDIGAITTISAPVLMRTMPLDDSVITSKISFLFLQSANLERAYRRPQPLGAQPNCGACLDWATALDLAKHNRALAAQYESTATAASGTGHDAHRATGAMVRDDPCGLGAHVGRVRRQRPCQLRHQAAHTVDRDGQLDSYVVDYRRLDTGGSVSLPRAPLASLHL
ncbi:hypothetical protein, variant [Saprolegnia diclina VS20]|uniref:Uncharacterized protein n=1 Tax=Saprolegnia diclina (strain VS20) TaxID=1156394 RepID=T0RME9_SAPDV|nr:hypothetical protein, variant [Saprolegnia diclina VS20]EQC31162.1 hypothetical protein, variant [Saprolegnia diclina VS20]|eukprot:XP_008615334.1 hypothetical protein, variant [Saprolegnia diclina VS20]